MISDGQPFAIEEGIRTVGHSTMPLQKSCKGKSTIIRWIYGAWAY